MWDFVDQALLKHDPGTGRRIWAYGGDFGETHHDAQFCLNGIFFPDRTPKPAAEEFKFLQRPYVSSLERDGDGTLALRLRNREAFGSHQHLILQLSLGAGNGGNVFYVDLEIGI